MNDHECSKCGGFGAVRSLKSTGESSKKIPFVIPSIQTGDDGDGGEDDMTPVQKDVLLRAIITRADIVGPTRLHRQADGDYTIETGRGENCPSNVSEESEALMNSQFERLLTFLDNSVYEHENSPMTVDEEEGAADAAEKPLAIAKAPWFNPTPILGAVYEFSDLTYQLLPLRSRHLVLSAVRASCLTSTEWVDSGPKVKELCQALDATCIRGDSCVYRTFFPHVGQAGPRLLPVTLVDLLTHIPVLSVTAKDIAACFSAAYGVLCHSSSPADNPSIYACSPIKCCICCVLAEQVGACLHREGETFFSTDDAGRYDSLTLIGIKSKNGRSPSQPPSSLSSSSKVVPDLTKMRDGSFFTPSINLHSTDSAETPDRILLSIHLNYQIVQTKFFSDNNEWTVKFVDRG